MSQMERGAHACALIAILHRPADRTNKIFPQLWQLLPISTLCGPVCLRKLIQSAEPSGGLGKHIRSLNVSQPNLEIEYSWWIDESRQKTVHSKPFSAKESLKPLIQSEKKVNKVDAL